MDNSYWLLAAGGVGAVFGAGGAWALAVLRWNRLSRDYRNQLSKSEQARQFVMQQGDQARRQVEALQKEVGELRHRLASQSPQVAASVMQAEVTPISDEELLLQASLMADLEPDEPDAEGFAKTQMILPGRR
ncbi:hypothetical protein [Inhella crocodyli]|jgi:hypothetical protein|uniref:Uncharacterized protein n=1 Tax=Inhella crocodyli TaxID=2499851 RepID=A0A3S2UXX7_9BURK|nr:hypothetical protein [Inhella crocodyli]RVT87718.1 hypothetical protein EOD73_01435 [Inhella crocodyli]